MLGGFEKGFDQSDFTTAGPGVGWGHDEAFLIRVDRAQNHVIHVNVFVTFDAIEFFGVKVAMLVRAVVNLLAVWTEKLHTVGHELIVRGAKGC